MYSETRLGFIKFITDEGIWDKLTPDDKVKIHANQPIYGEGKPYQVSDSILGLFPEGSYKKKDDSIKINNLFYKGIHNRIYQQERDDWFKYPEKFLKSNFKPDNDIEYQPSFQAEMDSSYYTDFVYKTREAFRLFIENGQSIIKPDFHTIEEIIENNYEVNNETIPIFYSYFGVCLVDPYNFNSFEEYCEFLNRNPYKDFDYGQFLAADTFITDEGLNAIYYLNDGRIGKEIKNLSVSNKNEAIAFLTSKCVEDVDVYYILLYLMIHRGKKIDVCRCLNTIFDTYNPFYKNELIIMEHLIKREK